MQSFDDRIEKMLPTTAVALSRIDSLKGQWIGGARLSPQVLGRLKRSVLVTSTGASTRIEGSKLSDAEVEQLMRGLSMRKLVDRDAQEVRGYYETLVTIFDSWQNIELTENNVKHLHAQLLKYSVKDERQRGEYKKFDNNVVATDPSGQVISTIFETTAPYLTPKEMAELLAWTNQALDEARFHPLLVVANFVVEFLKIHPFLDGNGRMSRLLTNLLMLKAGYAYMPYVSHEKLVEDNKTEYYIALRRSQRSFKTADETVEAWTAFFLDVTESQATQAIALISGEAIEKLLSPKQLLVWQYTQTVDEATIQNITETTGVARPTVRQAVERLLALKRIERLGQGRASRYRKR